MRRRRPQRGFTLIELMAVLAIVAILATLATVGVTSGNSPARTSDNVVGMMGFARLRAMSTQIRHRVQFEPNVVSIWVATDLPGGAPKRGFQAPCPTCYAVLESRDVQSGVVIWNSDTIVYAGGGQNPAQNATLNFSLDFLPDGSATTGATLFLVRSDGQGEKERIFVYPVTGSAHAFEGW